MNVIDTYVEISKTVVQEPLAAAILTLAHVLQEKNITLSDETIEELVSTIEQP